MPSARPFSRCPFNSTTPIIELAAYHQPLRSGAIPVEQPPVNVSLIATTRHYSKSSCRPNTTESDNQTVCLEASQQLDDTLRKKNSQRFTELPPNPEINQYYYQENLQQNATLHQPNRMVGGGDGEQETEKTINICTTRKLDLIILPLTFLLYLSEYLQRSNISNGALYGLRIQVLNDKHLQYAMVLSSFSITYLLISIGGSIIIPKLSHANKSLSFAVFLTSIASIMIGFSSNLATVLFCRSLIGVGGAILGKSMEVYYYLMYTQAEMAKRMSFFIGSAVLAGALNGIIAYVIGFINSTTKVWSILYFFQGGLGVLLAIISYIILPTPKLEGKNLITTTRELSSSLSSSSRSRIHLHNQESLSELNSIGLDSNLFDWKSVGKILLGFNIWLSSFAYGCINLSVGSLVGYLPIIIQSFGYSARTSQILTTWPYLTSLISIFLVARVSDKTGIRSLFIIFLSLISIIGWTLLILFEKKLSIKYFAIFLVVIGAFCPIPLTLSWTLSNCTSYTQRATSFIMMQIFGQIFTISSNFIFHTNGEDNWPKNIGYMMNLISNVCVSLVVGLLATRYAYLNRIKRKAGIIQNLKFL